MEVPAPRIQFEYDIKTGQGIDLSVHAFNEPDKLGLMVFLGKKRLLTTRLVVFLLLQKIINERIRKAKANAKKK